MAKRLLPVDPFLVGNAEEEDEPAEHDPGPPPETLDKLPKWAPKGPDKEANPGLERRHFRDGQSRKRSKSTGQSGPKKLGPSRRQHVLKEPGREQYANIYTPSGAPPLVGDKAAQREILTRLKAEAAKNTWWTELPQPPDIARFGANGKRWCAYAETYFVPAKSILAIAAYSGAAYEIINNTLRNERKLHLADTNIPNWLKDLITDLDKGLFLLPKAQQGKVYRCMRVNEEFGRAFVKGHEFTDYGFISTSFAHPNFGNGNYIFNIKLKKNSSAVDISGISMIPQEGEVLFPRGQRFKVSGREIDGVATDEHVPYFDFDELKAMSAEDKARNSRKVTVYMYQI